MKLQALTMGLAALLLAACTGAEEVPIPEEPLRGGEFTTPIPKPDFTLTTHTGETFDFQAETDGYATLLFFGYTYCPDICPLHMSRIGAALNELDDDIVDRVKVIFVSADPDRDSGVFAMGGHEDGIVAYGSNIDEAGRELLDCLERAERLEA